MSPIDPALRIRSVKLAVSDLPRSVEFYEGSLGLPLIARENGTATLGADPRAPALVLEQLSTATPLPPAASGLYHVAWLHPTRGALAETVRRLAAARWPLEGASDHGVSEALYLSDPDGLGIEIYSDRPREQWPHSPEGDLRMVTLPLDLEDLLAQSSGPPRPAIAPDAIIGHVHLKVADVARTRDFYREAVGMDEQATMPSAAFLSAGGYHHHIGLNSWQSEGAGPAPETAPGLRRVEFALSGTDELRALDERLQRGGAEVAGTGAGAAELLVRDPDGELLAFA
jgi:catechol 2,3-dioxygenase